MVVQMKREIRTLLTKRNAINKRIDTIRKALVGMATLVGDDVLKETFEYSNSKPGRGKNGITRACQRVLINSEHPMPARELYRQVCLEEPTLLADYRGAVTPLYTILGRLVKRGEARIVADENGVRAWQWIQRPCFQMDEHSAETHDYA